MTEDLSIVVTHCDDFYLSECLSILHRMRALKGLSIQVDGCRGVVYTGDGADKITSHKLCHGFRAFELVSACETGKILILDADFFCADETFWTDAIESSQSYDLVSIGQLWGGMTNLASTPFFLCDCKKMLQKVPIRSFWGHFASTWPELGESVFDHMKFPFLAAKKSTLLVDNWQPFSRRKHSFFHFWDSRHLFEKNFKDYEASKAALNMSSKKLGYLSYGISKSIYAYSRKDLDLPEKVWGYIRLLMSSESPTNIRNIQDVMVNLSLQLEPGSCSDRIRVISEKFFREFDKKEIK